METIRIDDRDDPRLAAYRDIRERDLVGRQDRFIAEGKVVLNILLAARRFEAESVLVLESRFAGLEPTLRQADLPIYVVPASVMDGVAGFHMHRGILAVGRRRPPQAVSALLAELPATALVVALAGIANHDNMGAIFRNAAAFGAGAVLLDDTCCDPLYRKSIRVSVGAALKVPFAVAGSAQDMVEALADAGFSTIALSPRGQRSIRDIEAARRTALLLGSEGEGLPETLMARLETARIPMVQDFDSLNVATASAIALYELSEGSKGRIAK
jgi:tRNA G18 (ribose-2'-O)-methylase SpoU